MASRCVAGGTPLVMGSLNTIAHWPAVLIAAVHELTSIEKVSQHFLIINTNTFYK